MLPFDLDRGYLENGLGFPFSAQKDAGKDFGEIMKHDAHVLKFKMQYFPTRLFFLSIFAFTFFGFLLGQMWGFNSCYNFKLLIP